MTDGWRWGCGFFVDRTARYFGRGTGRWSIEYIREGRRNAAGVNDGVRCQQSAAFMEALRSLAGIENSGRG